ncbi:uncharacterized protein LOC126735290 [Anthonomus grandis grandis]|uniref:uncharacterized protein LOC126735290 n=1 Tax=Anthonomus grandis grandis TaxID=2921223 RepID=UPI0021650CBC|nr:uncharacterized protein LOC126735290 [Anthonomus grandis grandis]
MPFDQNKRALTSFELEELVLNLDLDQSDIGDLSSESEDEVDVDLDLVNINLDHQDGLESIEDMEILRMTSLLPIIYQAMKKLGPVFGNLNHSSLTLKTRTFPLN